jgi:hypothetical protein
VTKSITVVALVCLLVAGAAATSILTRDSVPAAGIAMPAVVAKSPISNREAKGDKLTVSRVTAAADEAEPAANLSEPVREAFAYASADTEVPMPSKPAKAAHAAEVPAAAADVAVTHPKPAPKPDLPKPYALFSDGQIAGIKERLKLSSSQEYYWPAVETALRAVGKKVHATRQANGKVVTTPIDPDSDEVQQLKSAAMPLLWQLRDDQKDEVRKLARMIGLEQVAAAI